MFLLLTLKSTLFSVFCQNPGDGGFIFSVVMLVVLRYPGLGCLGAVACLFSFPICDTVWRSWSDNSVCVLLASFNLAGRG